MSAGAADAFADVHRVDAMFSLADLLRATGYCRSAAYAAMQDQLLTRPVKVGRASRWPEPEVRAMAAALLRGDDEASRRALVRQLRALRGAPLLACVGGRSS
jgi:prophage regulatory protein